MSDNSSAPKIDEATGLTTTIEATSQVDEKALLRKIDMRVLPMLFLVYVAAFLDRVNVSNALAMDMPKELHLKGQQPNVALTIFFVPYVIFEIPSNILMKKFSPHIWLSICVFGFGVVMLVQGFVQNYSGLLTTRFLLGLMETGIFPGSFYLISFWYKQAEAQKRFTVYWCSVIVASAFGGLLASAIAKMDGTHGLSNWRWIFILEGIATIIVAGMAFFLISDFPEQAKWLSEDERRFVLAKTRAGETGSTTIKLRDLGEFFKEPKQYLGALMYFSVVVPIYGFAYFTPTVVKTLGFSVVGTQLRSVPPWAAALGYCLVMAYLSDRFNIRAPFVFLAQAFLIVGLSILLTTHSGFSLRYLGICFVCMGALGAGASIVCWYLMNLQGHKGRSIGSAWMIGFGNTGGIVAPFMFLPKYAPTYRTGYCICMAVAALGTTASILYAFLISRERRRLSKDGEKAATLYL